MMTICFGFYFLWLIFLLEPQNKSGNMSHTSSRSLGEVLVTPGRHLMLSIREKWTNKHLEIYWQNLCINRTVRPNKPHRTYLSHQHHTMSIAKI